VSRAVDLESAWVQALFPESAAADAPRFCLEGDAKSQSGAGVTAVR
jgi:hypothetical protein